MRTLKNRHRGNRTRKGGLIAKVKGVWTNVSGPSETQVNEYRRMEEEIMRLLAKGCKSADSNECLRDEKDVLLEEYKKKCDAYTGYEDTATFDQLLSIKDTIGELIRLRVQDSFRFPVKLTDTEEQKRIRKKHRDRIDYWSTIYTSIKQIFDAIRQKQHFTRIATVKEEYDSIKAQLPFNEAQCKSIKEAYEKTTAMIAVLEKEDALIGNGNEDVIVVLKARNATKQELYHAATNPELPQRRERFAVVERRFKELGLEDAEEKTRQDRQSQMIHDSIVRMDREQQRQVEQEAEKAKREEKRKIAKEMEKDAIKRRELATKTEKEDRKRAQEIKNIRETAELKAAIQKTQEEEIISNWKYLSSMTPHAIPEIKEQLIMFDAQIKKIMTRGLPREEEIRQIKEITDTWEAFLSEENEKLKKRKTAAQRAAELPTTTKLDTVEESYRWYDIQDQIEVLPESELKTQLIDIDSQIDALVYSSMDRVEMNIHVKRLMDKGEILINRNELIKETKKIYDIEERAVLMRNNSLLDTIPDFPIDEKHQQMKKIIEEWKEQVTEAHVMQTHREKLPPELLQQLVHLKEERKLIVPLDPRLKIINMHNGLIDKFIYKEPVDIGKIEDQIAKWKAV